MSALWVGFIGNIVAVFVAFVLYAPASLINLFLTPAVIYWVGILVVGAVRGKP